MSRLPDRCNDQADQFAQSVAAGKLLMADLRSLEEKANDDD